MGVLTFNPENVVVLLGGIPLKGFGPETFIKIAYNEDSVALKVGNDGAAIRSLNPNRSATIELTVLEGSLADLELNALWLADRASGAGAVPFAVNDPASGTSHAAETAWVKKPPETSYGKSPDDKTWILETDRLASIHSPLAAIRAAT